MKKLIEKLLSNSLTKEEMTWHLQHLDEDENFKAELLKEYQKTIEDKDDFKKQESYDVKKFEEMFIEIKEKIVLEPTTHNLNNRTIVWKLAAAAVVGILISIFYFEYFNNKNESFVAYASKSKTAIFEKTIVENSTDKLKDLKFIDGTIIQLYKGSKIAYKNTYNKSSREIVLLKGKAKFSVIKNAKKPFTVISKDIKTIDIGTEFCIDMVQKNKIYIKVFEGKVLVKNNKKIQNVYLTGGDQFSYDIKAEKYVLNEKNIIHKKEISNHEKAKTPITFMQFPLIKIFEKMESDYGIVIMSNDSLLNDKIYSGSYYKEDSPAIFLNKICQKYNWKISKESNVFIIKNTE